VIFIKNKNGLFDIFLYVFFVILAIFTIFPFYNVLILSVANTISYVENTPYILPYTIDFSGFKEIIGDPYFLKSFSVTVFITVVGTFLNMLFSVTTAYVLSRKRLLGRTFILRFVIFTMLFSGGMVPTYLVITKIGLLNSVWSMIFPCLINSYYIFIMKNYFQAFPDSLDESARIDGANEFQVLTKIYLPISKPFLATFILFYGVERWNEWWHSYLYVIDKNIKPLQTYLKDIFVVYNSQVAQQLKTMFSSQGDIFPQSVQMATIIITMVPIMCVYPFIQKYFVKGLMLGSMKE